MSVAGLVIAIWLLDRGDWKAHRPQLVVGWVVVGVVAVWMVGRELVGWLG